MKQLIIIAALMLSAVTTPAMAVKIIPAPATTSAASTTSTKPAVATTTAAPASAPAAIVSPAPARPVVAAVTPVAVQPPPPAAAPVKPAPAPSSRSAFYVGAQVGDSTIGALLGYQLSKMYSMEVSYDYVDPTNTVEVSGATTRLETSRVGISGLALFPIKFSDMGPMAIYIKVGYARTTDKSTFNDPGIPGLFPATTTVTTTLKTGVTGGAGVQVDLSNSSTARLGVNYVGGDRSVYLAALYKF
jgi:Outer membrane protein beta-barrel domain